METRAPNAEPAAMIADHARAARTRLPTDGPGGYASWLVASLQDPAAYGATESVELRETAISWVFLVSDRAYKLKKPVKLPEVDYSTPELRRAMCDEELRLNRRLAPEIYRDVRAVVRDGGRARLSDRGDPRAIDHVVEMSRYDETATLACAVERGEAVPLEVVGTRLAAFHADAARCHPTDPLAAWHATLAANFATLRRLLPARSPIVAAQERAAHALLATHGDELERRAADGRVRQGHGDLRAEHVLLTRPMAVVDCIEFDPARRQIDVGADFACLVVDLGVRSCTAAGETLLAAYRRAGGDPGGDRLFAFWCAHQAQVAATVALRHAGHAALGDVDELLRAAEQFNARAAGTDPAA
jgi:uncharacterized protein